MIVYVDEAGMDNREDYGYGWSWLKSRIRKQLDQFECLRDAIEHVLHLAS